MSRIGLIAVLDNGFYRHLVVKKLTDFEVLIKNSFLYAFCFYRNTKKNL